MNGKALSLKQLLELSPEDVYVTVNGKIVRDWTTLAGHDVFRVHLRVLGGKGGWSSFPVF